MINKFFLIFLSIVLFSCQEDNSKSDLYVKSSREFITEDGPHIDHKYGSISEFKKQHFKIEYLNDTIYAQAIQSVNACGDAEGAVNLNGDTLILTTKERKEELCTSISWYKYEYWIRNKGNKKIIIKQR